MRIANSVYSGLLLNLLFPGIAHFYFREYVFGVFVFVIWLIATVLFYISYLVELTSLSKLVLFGLPLIFYFFTFIDLSNSFKKKKEFKARTLRATQAIFVLALLYQILSPTAPVNFWLNNRPEIFSLESGRLSPIHSKGSLMKASPLDYKIKIAGFGSPFIHDLPDRYDLIRCQIEHDVKINAIVLGLSGEEVEVIEGTLIINGTPDFEGWISGFNLVGEVPLTKVDQYSILVATLNLGAVDKTYQVTMPQVRGKIEKFF